MRPETVRTVPRAPARQTVVAVAGLGVRLPGAAGPSGLLALSGLRRFAHEAPEHAHALAAATDALAAASARTPGTPGASGAPGARGSTATVWASSTAGLAA